MINIYLSLFVLTEVGRDICEKLMLVLQIFTALESNENEANLSESNYSWSNSPFRTESLSLFYDKIAALYQMFYILLL